MRTHSKSLTKILQINYKAEYEVITKINVNIEICMVEWVFSLFSSLIPLDLQIEFYEGFFAEGWIFFYKMCLAVIESINLVDCYYKEPEDVYIALKLGKVFETDKRQSNRKWNEIIERANKIYLI